MDMFVVLLFSGRRVVSASASASARGVVRDMFDVDVFVIGLIMLVGDGVLNEIIVCFFLNDFCCIDFYVDFIVMKTRTAFDFVSRKRVDIFCVDDCVLFEF